MSNVADLYTMHSFDCVFFLNTTINQGLTLTNSNIRVSIYQWTNTDLGDIGTGSIYMQD